MHDSPLRRVELRARSGLDQEEHELCERLIAAAADEAVELVLPMFCLAEPLETLGRRHKSRLDLQDRLQAELGQLRRSETYRDLLGEVDDVDETVAALLIRSGQDDVERLERLERLMNDLAI